MDEIQAKEYFTNIIDVIKLPVKVGILEKLAQLVEDKKCILGVRLVNGGSS